MEQAEGKGEKQPKIKRGRFDSLTLYEITDYELDVLATGSPSSVFLNFAIFFVSTATSFLIALCTINISSGRLFNVFVIIVAVGYSIGIVLFCVWFRNRKEMSKIIKRIKERIPRDDASVGKENSAQ